MSQEKLVRQKQIDHALFKNKIIKTMAICKNSLIFLEIFGQNYMYRILNTLQDDPFQLTRPNPQDLYCTFFKLSQDEIGLEVEQVNGES